MPAVPQCHPISSSFAVVDAHARSITSVRAVHFISALAKRGGAKHTGRAVLLVLLLLLFYVLGQHCGKQASSSSSSRLRTRPRRWHH